MTFAMRIRRRMWEFRGAFGVASGNRVAEESLHCAELAIKEVEKVFSYSSLGRVDILDDPNQLSISAMQRQTELSTRKRSD